MDSAQGKTHSRVQKHNNTNKKNQKKKSNDKRIPASLWIVLAIIAFVVGSFIGYGLLGKSNPLEVLNPSTWIHMFKLIFG